MGRCQQAILVVEDTLSDANIGVSVYSGEVVCTTGGMRMITKQLYGELPDGGQVFLYTLTAGSYRIQISTYGATLVRAQVPDRHGKQGDVVLGFDSLEAYRNAKGYLGATVGRFANRIAKASFMIDGKSYRLSANEGENTLHGGKNGFDKRNWSALTSEADDAPGLHLSLVSEDGDQGFPGNMRAYVDYILKPTGELEITYVANCDRKCPINLTNHSYFNLAGTGDILSHELELACDKYLPVDAHLIPTGQILSVKGTPFDFNKRKAIGRDIAKTVGGYDHCMVLRDTSDTLRRFGKVWERTSGRTLELYSTMLAVQFYSGNHLQGTDVGREGHPYLIHQGFCLETEHFPDAPNRPHFPDCIQEPGEEYKHKTVYKFGLE